MSLNNAVKEDFDYPGICPFHDENFIEAYYLQDVKLACSIYLERLEMEYEEYEEYVARFHDVYKDNGDDRYYISWETNRDLGCIKSDSIESLVEQLLIAY